MSTGRIVYIDVIKVFLTCMVVAHHAGQAYGPTGGVWPVTDSQSTAWLGSFFFINASYMMGLYFFISGYFMVFSIGRKSNSQFVADRLKRLGIPLLFFTLVIFLPFNYFGSGATGNIFAFFWNSYFHEAPRATGHLWFVASLLVYSILYLFVFKKGNTPAPVQKVVNRPFHLWYVFLYILLLTLVSALVRLKYPIDTWRTWIIPVEVAHIPQYFSLFVIGAFFNRNQWLEQFKLKYGILFFLLAAGAFIASEWMPPAVSGYWLTESFVESLLCVGISMSLLTLFRVFAVRMNRLIRLLSENAYGIYLFHVLIVILLQQLLLHWTASANLKFLVVTTAAIFLSLVLTMILRRNKFLSRII